MRGRVATALACAISLSACFDFVSDRETCRRLGRCGGADASVLDSGSDGGSTDDAGTLTADNYCAWLSGRMCAKSAACGLTDARQQSACGSFLLTGCEEYFGRSLRRGLFALVPAKVAECSATLQGTCERY